MGNKFVRNYLYDMVYRVVIILLPLLLTPYIARVIGPEGLGIYGFTSSVTVLFCVFAELGTATYGVSSIARCMNNEDELSILYSELKIFRVICVFISYIMLLVFVLTYKKYTGFFLINSMILIADAFDISWYLEGIENFKTLSVRNICVRIVSAISIFIFVKHQDDLDRYIFILALASLLGNIFVLIQIKQKRVRFWKCNIKRHIKPMLFYALPQFAIYINATLDKSILGFLSIDSSSVAFYSQPERIIQVAQSILTSLGFVLFPRISKLVSESKLENAKNMIYKVASIVALVGVPVMLGIIITADIFIPVFLGDGYEESIHILRIYAPIIFIQGMRAVVCTPLFLPLKRGKSYNISVIVCVFINITLDIILIPVYGAMGATFATVFSELVVLIVQLWFLRDIINLKRIVKIVTRYFMAYVGMSVIVILVKRTSVNGFIGLIALAVSGILSYMAILFLLYRKDIINLLMCLKIK